MNDVLNGRFTIIETISENRLFKTVDTATGCFAAVKKWSSDDVTYESELCALSSIIHASVPQFIAAFEESGSKYIAETWIEGHPVMDGSPDNLIDFAVQCAEFLCYLSSDKNNIRIHGDIKPSNVMLQNGKVFFVDFESSCLIGPNAPDDSVSDTAFKISNRQTRKIISEYYTPPEIYFEKPAAQSDQYAVGMILAYLLGGVGHTGLDMDLIPDQEILKSVIQKCTAFNVHDRYKNAEEFAAALYKIQAVQNKKQSSVKLFSSSAISPCAYDLIHSISLYVDCNVCFSWELAAAAADSFGMRTCIIALTNRTQRKLDYYAVNDKYYGEDSLEESTHPYIFDSKSLYCKDAESWQTKGLIHRREDCANLFYSSGRLIDEIEPENERCITDLIEWGKQNFDCLLFITDRYDDKPVVQNLSANCDYTIATPLANVDDVEACKSYYECFGGNVLYVAWEFNDKCSLPENSISLIVGEDQYLGSVCHNDERTYKRNYCGKIRPIFNAGGHEENIQYINIINRIFGAACGTSERSCASV